ncbi:hypothetical protein [Denitratimonas sp. CY0512]|uniref:hypothetical protein n=1 Tax=Denitratimonas sp. CY0512 TaxID=3131940 RepID=UPI0030A70E31
MVELYPETNNRGQARFNKRRPAATPHRGYTLIRIFMGAVAQRAGAAVGAGLPAILMPGLME